MYGPRGGMIFCAMNEESMDDIQEIETLRRVIHRHLRNCELRDD